MAFDYPHTSSHMDGAKYYYGQSKMFCSRCLELTGTTYQVPESLIVSIEAPIETKEVILKSDIHYLPEKFHDRIIIYHFQGSEVELGRMTIGYQIQRYSVKETATLRHIGEDFDFYYMKCGYRVTAMIKNTSDQFFIPISENPYGLPTDLLD